MSLRAFVADRIAEALGLQPPHEILREIEIPPKPEFGDFAFPCAKLARQLRRSPAQIAAELAPKLEGEFERVEVAGPYLNFFVRLPEAAACVLPEPTPLEFSGDQRVVLEFSQPNTHKAFHVGHMRNLCLGDTIGRLLRGTGAHVVAVNYIGDMGVHIAKCLWGLQRKIAGDPPETGRGEWLGEVYTQVHLQLEIWYDDGKSQENFQRAMREISDIHQRLETGYEADPDLWGLWSKTRLWSLEEFAEIYQWSGVPFDHVYFESSMAQPSMELVEKYLGEGVLIQSRGAVGILNEELPHMPFFMLRKSDGTGLYATKDLALAQMKFWDWAPKTSLHVVDVRQTDHFRHVFLALQKLGIQPPDTQCKHLAYEMVEMPDGPMSARKGNIVTFRELRRRMVDHIRSTELDFYKGDWPEEEIERCANQLALGAIRYGMLNASHTQRIVFDMTAWMQLRGNTGPYLQYTACRLASILRKCALEGKAWDSSALDSAVASLEDPAERRLVIKLDEFSFVVRAATEELRPNLLCNYLHLLAQTINHFSQTCPVKSSEGPLLQGRLLLVMAALRTLSTGLDFLGIPIPSRM